MSDKRETLKYQAEVSKVLRLVINSLYSHPEIFLRELISNASDALDKLRYQALTDHSLIRDECPLEIRISADKEAGTLRIEDFGIGMSRDELIENLGTVAHSGTIGFLEALKGGENDVSLIGQFGVGFYSAYLVAEHVEVVSRSAGADEAAWRWTSDAQESFTIEPAEREETGTAITLQLGSEHLMFLDEWKLQSLIERYSDYISHPIKLQVERPVETEEEPDNEEQETSLQWVQTNKASALWQRTKSEIEQDDYEAFYKHLTHDWEAPISHQHFTVEGAQLFTGLLFIPSRPPFDLFMPDSQHGIRLYVRRVFIMDDCEELLPRWLRFLRGVVDSDDLPLNVSREMLQDSNVVRFIRKQITKKTLDMLDAVADREGDDYATLWEHYGTVLKEGVHLAPEHKDRLAELLRFRSSANDTWNSLAEYKARMPEGQDAIYVIMGLSVEAAASSPHLEALRQRGSEVLYLTDPIDEWVVKALETYEGSPLLSAMRADLNLADAESDALDDANAEFKPFLEHIQGLLEDDVETVRLSQRLTTSPACLVVPEGGLHTHIERLIRASDAHSDLPKTKRILELNPKHSLIRQLANMHRTDPQSDTEQWIVLLHQQALLAEGSPIAQPARFAEKVAALMTGALEQHTDLTPESTEPAAEDTSDTP